MPSVHELELGELPIEAPALAADPQAYIEAARRRHPWLAKCGIGYVVHEYAAIRDLLMMDGQLMNSVSEVIEIMGARGTPWGEMMEDLMLNKSGAEHARIRSSVAAAFTPRNANLHRELMRKVIGDLLDEWAPKGAFDFAEFAAHFPITVMFGLIGASPDALPRIRKALETQGMSFSLDPSLLPAMEEAYDVLYGFCDELVRQREASGAPPDGDALLDALISTKNTGQLSEKELRDLLIFLFAAGYDTSKNQLTLIMRLMLDQPEAWARCAEEPAFCSQVVEEALRLASPANTYRTVHEEIVYRDVVFPKGTVLFFTLTQAGRDPAAFPQAAAFRPEREQKNRHMAFGRGAHICLGQYLARAQLEEGTHLIAQRLTRPRLDGEVTWRPFPGVWGIRTLPIAFEPGARRPPAPAQAA
jgi:cytochrome P450